MSQSLSRISPNYLSATQISTACQTNPVPYHVNYGGHKLHIDQNEKNIVIYGVTHIAVLDGLGGMIVGFVTIPNCDRISENRPVCHNSPCLGEEFENQPIF